MGEVVKLEVFENSLSVQHTNQLKVVVEKIQKLEEEQQRVFFESMPLIQEYGELLAALDGSIDVLSILYPQKEFQFVYK